MLQIILVALVVGVILARRPIMDRIRSQSPSASYRPSRLIESGLLVLALGMLVPVGLAEGRFINYDGAFALTMGGVILGLAISLVGLGVEFRRNFSR